MEEIIRCLDRGDRKGGYDDMLNLLDIIDIFAGKRILVEEEER